MIHNARHLGTDTNLDPRRFFVDSSVESAPMEDDA
jgi:hypothetical protein